MTSAYSIDQCIKAADLYKEGRSYQEIAAKTGISYGSLGYCIKKIAGKRGLTRGRGSANQHRKDDPIPVGATSENPTPKPSRHTAGGSGDFHNFKEILKTILKSNMGDTMKLLVVEELVER